MESVLWNCLFVDSLFVEYVSGILVVGSALWTLGLWSRCCGIVAVESLLRNRCCAIVVCGTSVVEYLLWNLVCVILVVEYLFVE